ncbi:restriction endonuclease subunit S, partial [Brachyspira catarrhinii]
MNKLPNGWEYKKLKDIGKAFTGMTPSTLDKENFGNEHLFVTSADIKENKYIFNSIRKLSDKGFEKSRKFKKGDILYVCIGSIGKIALAGCDFTCNQQINVLRVSEGIDNEFVYYQLINSFPYISKFVARGVVPIMNKTTFENLTIAIPLLLDEQKRIASVLSKIDAYLENTIKLIEEKEKFKRGIAKKLLTCKKDKNVPEARFKEFNDEWETVKLGDLGIITATGVDKKIRDNEIPIKLLNYLDVFNRNKLYEKEITYMTTATEKQLEKCNIRKGDLFITPSSEDREGIAKSSVAMEDFHDTVYSYHIIRVRFNKEIDLKFKSYMCDTEFFHRQAYRLSDGMGQRYFISLNNFRNIEIC